MGFAETANILSIEQKVLEQGLGMNIDWPDEYYEGLAADQIWLHPSTLDGVMLGLSRPSMAWWWSDSSEKMMLVETIVGDS